VITFVRATTRQYNTAVAQLQREAARTNREIQQANYEKAINEGIRRSFEDVSLNVKHLGPTADFDKELESFKKHWSDMEGHAGEFRRQLSANPPASSEASYSLSNLTYDRSNIRYDRSSLDYKTRAAVEQINETRQAMERLSQAWSELQAAIAEDRRGAIRRDISKELVSAYTERAVSEIRRVEGLIQGANAGAKEIEKRADDLLLKAKQSFDRARKNNH
jgi:flagellin-specific chaperone FliS